MESPPMSPERSWHMAEIEVMTPDAAALLIERHACKEQTL
jgi:hypothetical protein